MRHPLISLVALTVLLSGCQFTVIRGEEMPANITVALIAAGAALVGGLLAGGTNYLVSRRALSRSGARLLADLEILEKAINLHLDERSVLAIRARVQDTLEWHTHNSVKRTKKRASRDNSNLNSSIRDSASGSPASTD